MVKCLIKLKLYENRSAGQYDNMPTILPISAGYRQMIEMQKIRNGPERNNVAEWQTKLMADSCRYDISLFFFLK